MSTLTALRPAPDELTPVQLFKCLADDTRARLMFLIAAEQELCVCELTCALDESQPKISRHLSLLRQNGLLADRRQGQWVHYRLHPELPAWARAVLDTTLPAHETARDQAHLQRMGDRPTRAATCC